MPCKPLVRRRFETLARAFACAAAAAWPARAAAAAAATTGAAAAAASPVAVTVGRATGTLSPTFLGLSYESSVLLPKEGRHYFDAANAPLVRAFRTLGVTSLRVGANGVDDPRVAVPDEKDIDALFGFARAAGAKVIYSLRLKGGDPSNSARLAAYIAAHDADALDCFAIGNEPNFYLPTYEAYLVAWRPHYDAILKAVPGARIDAPSTAGHDYYALKLADAIFADGHLAMASNHYYFLGAGPAGGKDPGTMRGRFLSDDLHKKYQAAYAQIGGPLAARGVPYRMDEFNSSFHGGSVDSSDTYASALWALDCTHWWAARHVLGINYHTGEAIVPSGAVFTPRYVVFTGGGDGGGVEIGPRPEAYALLAFTRGAAGRPLETAVTAPPPFAFDAYAYDDRGTVTLTLVNKSYGPSARPAAVTVGFGGAPAAGRWERLDLVQRDADVAAKTGITLGGAAIDAQGGWSGRWQAIDAGGPDAVPVIVAPASATLVRRVPAR